MFPAYCADHLNSGAVVDWGNLFLNDYMAMIDRRQTDTIHVPEGMAYTCHNEGTCCHVFDNIPVDAPAEAALQVLPIEELNRIAGNATAAAVTAPNAQGPTALKMARKGCGECSMLTAEKLCAIHSLAGEQAKPAVCREFPWRYTETPGGVYAGLSFVCPSVRKNRGQLLSEQVTNLALRYETSASVRAVASTVSLNARVSITWLDYLALERGLAEILHTDVPLTVRLKAMCILPAFLDQVLAKNPDVSLHELLEKLRATEYSHVTRLARKRVKSGTRPRRMFLGMFTSFANTLHRKGDGRFTTVAQVMNQYIKHSLGIGKVFLRPHTVSLHHGQLNEISLPETGPVADQVTRYIDHCIFRKDLLLSGDVNRRLRMLALNAALLPWYAAAQAKNNNRITIIDADWDEAIGMVERLYGFHSAFYKFFERNRVFTDIIDSFILKPSYPYTLFN